MFALQNDYQNMGKIYLFVHDQINGTYCLVGACWCHMMNDKLNLTITKMIWYILHMTYRQIVIWLY